MTRGGAEPLPNCSRNAADLDQLKLKRDMTQRQLLDELSTATARKTPSRKPPLTFSEPAG